MTHDSLVALGAGWLQRTKRCEPVLYGLSTGPEIPDVMGFQSAGPDRGSIVLECKASRSDFLRDKRKTYTVKMGDYRFILCPAHLLSAADVEKHAPGHGLLWAHEGKLKMEVILAAPRRAEVNHRAEVRHLLMALIHVLYNVADHGFELHVPTLTKWGGKYGMRPRPS